MFSTVLLILVVFSYVLAVPTPILVPQDPPCVPQYHVPGLSKEYSTIPLGPGMHYCDDSAANNTHPVPSTLNPPAQATNQVANSQNSSSTNAEPKSQSGPSDNGAEDNEECDEGSDNEDEDKQKATNPGSGSSQAGPPTGEVNTGVSPQGGSKKLSQPNPSVNNGTGQESEGTTGSNTSSNALSRKTFQATVTGYGGQCGSQSGSCGFLGSQGSYQGAVSVYWNTASLPGQCGTCWQLHDGTKIDGNKKPAGPIGTAPIVVMIDNTCAPDPSKPTGGPDGFQCNQNAQSPIDAFGSVTVVDLCADTGASDAFFGASGSAPNPGEDGHRAGLAIANITQVDCGSSWKGSVDHTESWTKYQASPGAKDAVQVKPGHRKS